MTNFLQILSLIFKLLPTIKEAVVALEAMFPDAGNGAAKKAIVNAALDQAMALTGETAAVYEAAKPALAVVIDHVVALTKKPATAPTTTPAAQ